MSSRARSPYNRGVGAGRELTGRCVHGSCMTQGARPIACLSWHHLVGENNGHIQCSTYSKHKCPTSRSLPCFTVVGRFHAGNIASAGGKCQRAVKETTRYRKSENMRVGSVLLDLLLGTSIIAQQSCA
eukprot:1160620-Pelagomonas_calceolata.AAC.2